jgi:phosphoesterase RecJ-like protein
VIDAAGFRAFDDLVAGGRVFVLVTHVNPDGDAIGSEVGLARFLVAKGKEIRIVNADPTPLGLKWLEAEGPAAEPYDPARHDALFTAADAVVLLDNFAPDRLGRLEPVVRAHAAKTFCIDHHPSRETLWGRNIVDTTSCATAVLVHELVKAAGWTPDRAAAEALYAGLATDTGFFRFNSTSPRAFRIAAELLEAGADPTRSYAEVYERNSPAYTRLLGHALAGLALEADGRLGVVTMTRTMIEGCAADAVDTSEVTTHVLAVEGVRIALLFRELPGGSVKVSLRSKGLLDVQALATEFGGGGHRNASGIVMSGTLDDVVRRVTARAVALARHAS